MDWEVLKNNKSKYTKANLKMAVKAVMGHGSGKMEKHMKVFYL
jgi:hypothetical protein